MSIRYRALHPSGHEVRLLEVQQPATGDVDEPVVCRLVHERLSDASEFIGLSTLYGDMAQPETVVVNGAGVAIPLHIAQALRHMRAVFLPAPPPPPPVAAPATANAAATAATTAATATATATETAATAEAAPPPPPPTAGARTPHPPTTVPAAPAPAKKPPGWLRSLLKNVKHAMLATDPHAPPTGTKTLRIWLDLVCINHHDAREEAHRRAHTALAYRHARLVVGWLGLKDDTSDLAVAIINAWDRCMPRAFGEPGHRDAHPDDYAPTLRWMGPVAHLSHIPDHIHDPREVPSYKAIRNFLNRPYFRNAWLLDDMANARFPAFLLGDDVVSWMQVLRLNRVNEDIKDHGADMFPDELRPLLEYMPLGSVYAFLKEFDRRQRLEGRDGVLTVASSSVRSSASRGGDD